MEPEIIFAPSAFKHDLSEGDIRYAFAHYEYDGPLEGRENTYIRIGSDRAGNLLELFFNEVDDSAILFHAMKCRSIFYHLLKP